MGGQMTMPLVALIVGGAGGIGWATVQRLASSGYTVVIADLEEAVTRLPHDRASAFDMALGVDVRSRDSINGMYNRIRNKFGVLDILVNCAGTIRPAPSSVADEVAWDQLIDIHLTGTFRCCQSAMPLLESSTAASIVNVGSVLGMRGVSARASYAAAKAGVEGLTRVLAVEWAKAGIRVNCVVPGYTMTPMNAEAVKVGKLDVGQLAKSIPLGRLASADDVAAGIEFLASVDSRYITGQTLVIDGGLTISGDWWSATELAIERLSE